MDDVQDEEVLRQLHFHLFMVCQQLGIPRRAHDRDQGRWKELRDDLRVKNADLIKRLQTKLLPSAVVRSSDDSDPKFALLVTNIRSGGALSAFGLRVLSSATDNTNRAKEMSDFIFECLWCMECDFQITDLLLRNSAPWRRIFSGLKLLTGGAFWVASVLSPESVNDVGAVQFGELAANDALPVLADIRLDTDDVPDRGSKKVVTVFLGLLYIKLTLHFTEWHVAQE